MLSQAHNYPNAILACEALAAKNIFADVIYIHTPKPFDYDVVRQSITKTGRVIVIEEHSEQGGIGDDVLRCSISLQYKFESISINNEFCHGYGSYLDHCQHFGLTKENIVNVAMGMLDNNSNNSAIGRLTND